MENIKGSCIIGNKIEFVRTEIDGCRVVYMRSIFFLFFLQFLCSDPHRGEGLQPVPWTSWAWTRAQSDQQEQRPQHGRHRHHPEAGDDVRLQGKIKSKAWI